MTIAGNFQVSECAPLLLEGDGAAFEILNKNGPNPIILVCEHASNRVPSQLQNLGLTETQLQSHVAWDPGAFLLAQKLSVDLDAPLIAARFSRLAYDCNRPPQAAGAMPAQTEVCLVPGNAQLSEADRLSRTCEIYQPFHAALSTMIAAKRATCIVPIVITIHSFTPVFEGTQRYFEICYLHSEDRRLCDAMHDVSTEASDYDIRLNQPYGPEDGVLHSIEKQLEDDAFPYVMIEVRNDLLATDSGLREISCFLSKRISMAVYSLDPFKQTQPAGGDRWQKKLSFDTLKAQVAGGEIDTVLVCLVDMQGRLMGKRFLAQHFVDNAYEETHCCNYLLATDLEMATPNGYAATSWQSGYGDYVMKPDLETLRPVPWLEGTAMVLCDVLDHHTHQAVPHSPRAILKAQIERLEALGLEAAMATELEFFLFERSFDEIRKSGFRDLTPISGYNEDYHILQTTKEEHVMRPIRNHLYAAGIPIENSKGEAEVGQEELNIKYDAPLNCADHHAIAKHAIKEIAWQHGHAASFLPKWHHDRVGSSSHIHQSLWKDGKSAFYDADGEHGMSELMCHYVAGMIKYARDTTYFLAPYVNSYKRFQKGTFAPTGTVWSIDNRTAGFRLCGEGTKSVRVECRIGGSDLNPYLAMAAQLAAGLAGIEEKLELQAPLTGDAYASKTPGQIPCNLRDAMATLKTSKMLRTAFGDGVVDHYYRCAEWEQEEFDRVVTDYEIARGFERA